MEKDIQYIYKLEMENEVDNKKEKKTKLEKHKKNNEKQCLQ